MIKMKKSVLQIIVIIAVFATGYLTRAYFEKPPATIEIPKERVITKTKYIDKVTKVPVEVVKEHTVFDPEATANTIVALRRKNSIAGVSYGADLDLHSFKDSVPVYGATYNRRIFSNFFLGASVYTNGTATVNLLMEF